MTPACVSCHSEINTVTFQCDCGYTGMFDCPRCSIIAYSRPGNKLPCPSCSTEMVERGLKVSKPEPAIVVSGPNPQNQEICDCGHHRSNHWQKGGTERGCHAKMGNCKCQGFVSITLPPTGKCSCGAYWDDHPTKTCGIFLT